MYKPPIRFTHLKPHYPQTGMHENLFFTSVCKQLPVAVGRALHPNEKGVRSILIEEPNRRDIFLAKFPIRFNFVLTLHLMIAYHVIIVTPLRPSEFSTPFMLFNRWRSPQILTFFKLFCRCSNRYRSCTSLGG